jgi:LysM repeat protein
MPQVDRLSRPSTPRPDSPTDGGRVHVCRRGDTLWDIARDNGVSLAALQKANPQLAGRGIFAGTEVRIPPRGEAAREAPRSTTAEPAPRAPASAATQQGRRQTAAAAEEAARRRVGTEPAAPADVTRTGAGAAARPAPGKVDVAATRGMTDAQKFDFYKQVIQDNGGKFHTAPNARNIVGVRRETNALENGGRGREDDTFVMLWQDKSGRKHVREFTGTTEGSDRVRRTFSSDVNGDGSRDLGRIPLGHYEYRTGTSERLGRVLRPTKAFQVERDFNHDGRYTGAKEKNADVSAAFLFHAGSSAGCQTMDGATFERFWRSLNSSGAPSKIGYTLVAG